MNIKQKDIKTVCNYRKSHIQYILYLQLCCHMYIYKVNRQTHYTHLSLLSGPTGSSEHYLLCFPLCEFKSDITPTTIYYVYRGAASCVFSLILKKHCRKKLKGNFFRCNIRCEDDWDSLLTVYDRVGRWCLWLIMKKMQHRHEHSRTSWGAVYSADDLSFSMQTTF